MFNVFFGPTKNKEQTRVRTLTCCQTPFQRASTVTCPWGPKPILYNEAFSLGLRREIVPLGSQGVENTYSSPSAVHIHQKSQKDVNKGQLIGGTVPG